jgi:hypothetical protein
MASQFPQDAATITNSTQHTHRRGDLGFSQVGGKSAASSLSGMPEIRLPQREPMPPGAK